MTGLQGLIVLLFALAGALWGWSASTKRLERRINSLEQVSSSRKKRYERRRLVATALHTAACAALGLFLAMLPGIRWRG